MGLSLCGFGEFEKEGNVEKREKRSKMGFIYLAELNSKINERSTVVVGALSSVYEFSEFAKRSHESICRLYDSFYVAEKSHMAQ